METEIQTCTEPNLRIRNFCSSLSRCLYRWQADSGYWARTLREPKINICAPSRSTARIIVTSIGSRVFEADFVHYLLEKHHGAYRVVICADRAETKLPPQSACVAVRVTSGVGSVPCRKRQRECHSASETGSVVPSMASSGCPSGDGSSSASGRSGNSNRSCRERPQGILP